MIGWHDLHRWVLVNPRLLLIVWPFLVAVLVLLVLAITSIDIVSSARAYVAGESAWSKGQKEAVYHLLRYAQSQDDAAYREFLAAIAIPEGDRLARIELEKPDPDFKIVRAGFLAGRNHPDDIEGMIWLFRRFRQVGFVTTAIGMWANADPLIVDLRNVGDRLHAQIAIGDIQPQVLSPILADIQRIDEKVTPYEVAFSQTLGEVSRRMQEALKIFLLVSALVLVVIGILLSRRVQRRGDALEQALRLSEERYNLAVNGSHDGIWDWDFSSKKIYCSAQLKDFIGHDELGNYITTDAFLHILHADDREAMLQALRKHLGEASPYDLEYRLRTHSGKYRWFRVRGNAIRADNGQPIRMAGSATDITERKLAEMQLRYQASHDALTGLINRHEFECRLGLLLRKIQETGGQHALLYLDLDQFKAINDSCGHSAGDEVLRQVGKVLDRRLRDGDTLARLGGDEFGILLEDCPAAAAQNIAEELRLAISDFRFVWREFSFELTASIGLANVDGELNTLAEIMSAADATCYLAKDQGRNRVTIFRR